MTESQPEVWLRGPVPGVPTELQPVAHALMQAAEEVQSLMQDFPRDFLWSRPAGVASAGFHLQHITGVVDRLFTYARGEPLSESQRAALAAEGKQPADEVAAATLVHAFHSQVERAVEQLRATDPHTLSDARTVGRRQLPSTVLGLLFHAAEHVQRHVGQLSVTVRVQRGENSRGG
jgi:uncharacterized damage-inducible protein DinB